MWRALASGLLIRWCASLSLLTTLAAPRWIGANEFGVAATVMAVPYLVHGLCEPVIVTLTISCLASRSGFRSLARVRNDVALASVLGMSGAFLFAVCYVPQNMPTSPAVCGLLAGGFVVVAMVNTWLIGLGYALREHSTLMRAYAVAGIVQPVTLWLLRAGGPGAFLLSLILCQCAFFVVMWCSESLRKELWHLLTAQCDSTVRPDYLAAVAPRISLLLLNTGTVLLAGILFAPARVASFRMSIGVAGALNYIAPVSPQVLQATLAAGDPGTRHSARTALTTTFLVMCALCGLLFVWSVELLQWLLGQPPATSLDGAIFLAMPFFLLIQPLSTYFYSTGRSGIVLSAALGCFLAFAAGAICGDPRIAFAGGAVTHIAVSLGHVVWPAKRRATDFSASIPTTPATESPPRPACVDAILRKSA